MIPAPYGWDSNIILEELMQTPRMTQAIRDDIDQMYQAYDDDNLGRAEELADKIDRVTNGRNDCVAGIRVMISRKRRSQHL